MISHQTKGTSFRGLQNYLFAGKIGVEIDNDRVAYVATFNLGELRNPAIAARLMRATAAQNFRVEKPVLHLSINPPPEAKLSREELRQVAVNVLHNVGLAEHQALLVVHHDLDRQHAHLMVNRIHPETLLAWKRDFDYRVVNDALDREAARLGLRRVQREKPGLSKAAYWKARNNQQEPFADFLRPKVEKGLVAATSWDEVSKALGEEGVYLQKRGQGLVVTDGAENAKLSALSDIGGLKKFEQAYGETFADYAERAGDLEPEGVKALRDRESDLADPRELVDGVLEKVTQHDAVFTADDVRRHAFWAAGGQNLTDLVLGSPEVLELGVEAQREDSQGKPIDFQTIYTTRENWQLEGRLSELAERIVSSSKEATTPVVEAPGLGDSRLSDEQKAAVETILANRRLAVLAGPAGAGKGWVIGEVRQAYEDAGYIVRGMAPSGIAAAQLRDQGLEARTIAAYEYQWGRGRGQLTDRDVVVLDEVSMVSTRQMVSILEEVDRSGARLVVAGDQSQLSPVGAGDPYRVFHQEVGARLPAGVATLSRVYRQEQDWQREAADQVRRGDARLAIREYFHRERVRWASQHRELLPLVTEQVIADRLRNPEETQLALAVRREDVKYLNRAIRFERKRTGQLGEEVRVGGRAFAVRDRVVFMRNDPLGKDVQAVDCAAEERGVQRGDLGTIQAVEEGRIRVRLDAGRDVAFDPRGYAEFDHGYAATVHRAQGASIDRVYYVPSRGLSKSAAYTALSRHRKDMHLFLSKEAWLPEGVRNPRQYADIHLEPRADGLSSAEKGEALKSLEWFMKRESKIDMAHQRAAALEQQSPEYATAVANENKARSAVASRASTRDELAPVVPIRPELDAATLDRVEALKDTLMTRAAVFVSADVDRLRIEADLSKGEVASLYDLPDVLPARDDSLDGTIYTTRSYLERETAVLEALGGLQDADRLHLIDGPTAARTERLLAYVGEAVDSGHSVEVLAVSRRRADELALAFDGVQGVAVRTTAAAARLEPEARQATLTVLDEASRLSTGQFEEVLPPIQAREAHVVLAGDVAGPKPFEAGDPYRGLVDETSTAERLGLQGRESWQAWDQDAFAALRRGDAAEALNEWAGVRRLGWAKSRAETLSEAATAAVSDVVRHREEFTMAFAYRKTDAVRLEAEIREQLVDRGVVSGGGVEISGKTYAAGDRVELRQTLYHSAGGFEQVSGPKNEARRPVSSGTRAIVESVDSERATLRLETGRTIAVNPTAAPLEHAYARTVMRAPEVDRVHLVLDRFIDSEALLQGVSRHSADLRLYADRETFTSADHLAYQLEGQTPRDLARDHVALDEARATLHALRQEPPGAELGADPKDLEGLVASKLPASAVSFDEHLQRIVHTRELVHALRDDLVAAYRDPQATERAIARMAFEQGPTATAEVLRETPEKLGDLVGKTARAALSPATVESLERYGARSAEAEVLVLKRVATQAKLDAAIAAGKPRRTVQLIRASLLHTESELTRLSIRPRSREARVVKQEISMLERGVEKLGAAKGADVPDRLQALRDRLGAHDATHRAAHTLDHLARVAPKKVLWNSLRQGVFEKPGLLRQAAVTARRTHVAFHKVSSVVRALKSTRERSLHDAALETAKQLAKTAAWSMVAKAAPVAVYVPIAAVKAGHRALKKLRDLNMEKGRGAGI